MCGSGRTGTFAWQQEQEGEEQGGKSIIPDITTCGKAITSGYCPLSCVFNKKFLMFYLMVQVVLIVVILIKVSYCMCSSSCRSKIIKRDNLLDNVVKMGLFYKNY